jgi:hypothetical protein
MLEIDKKIRYHTEIKNEIDNDESLHWKFRENNWHFDYLIYPNKKSDKLLILMPAALSKNKKITLPYFHRHSWAKSFNMNVIVVSDPTLSLNRDLLGGWFLGNASDYVFNRIIGHITLVQKELNIKNKKTCFSGSSLGGFGALLGATLLEGSLAYAENPQLDLREYKFQTHIDNLSKYCFNNDINSFFKRFPERFSILEAYQKYSNVPNSYIVQKQSDVSHYETQFKRFMRKSSDLNLAKNLFFAEELGSLIDDSGHTPLTLSQMKLRIEFLFNSTHMDV